ncbi:unnamed protein product [Bursaphelenchus xylophilus]|nr:unnamed protein product [Bursaphelenchus xylophilus]CAG9121870.1 unnamed protein product [Bursaphelenchus xylophilus]
MAYSIFIHLFLASLFPLSSCQFPFYNDEKEQYYESKNFIKSSAFAVTRKGDYPVSQASHVPDLKQFLLKRRKQEELKKKRAKLAGLPTVAQRINENKQTKRFKQASRSSEDSDEIFRTNSRNLQNVEPFAKNETFFVTVPISIARHKNEENDICVVNAITKNCCNASLEAAIVEAYDEIRSNPQFVQCNLHRIVQSVQNTVEQRFGRQFEVVVSPTPFVSKSHQANSMHCELKLDGKYIVVYETPNQEEEIDLIDVRQFLSPHEPPDNFEPIAQEEMQRIRRKLNAETHSKKSTYLVYGPID